MKMKTPQTAALPKQRGKTVGPKPAKTNTAWTGKTTSPKAAKSPPKSKMPLDPAEAAPLAAAPLICCGQDARCAFDVLRLVAGDRAQQMKAVEKLGTLLRDWDSHLPSGRREGDTQFWSGVAEACENVSWELDDLDSLVFGMARMLFGAIGEAAIIHLREAEAAAQH